MLIRLLFLLLFAWRRPGPRRRTPATRAGLPFSASAIDAKTIEARWQITDQYYMYRDKFKFVGRRRHPGHAEVLPPGKVKEDENFGKVETYRKEVKILFRSRPPGRGDA
jgi:thiol:disulfide interchange protein